MAAAPQRYHVVKVSLNPEGLQRYLNRIDAQGFNVISINYPLSTTDQVIVFEDKNVMYARA